MNRVRYLLVHLGGSRLCACRGFTSCYLVQVSRRFLLFRMLNYGVLRKLSLVFHCCSNCQGQVATNGVRILEHTIRCQQWLRWCGSCINFSFSSSYSRAFWCKLRCTPYNLNKKTCNKKLDRGFSKCVPDLSSKFFIFSIDFPRESLRHSDPGRCFCVCLSSAWGVSCASTASPNPTPETKKKKTIKIKTD